MPRQPPGPPRRPAGVGGSPRPTALARHRKGEPGPERPQDLRRRPHRRSQHGGPAGQRLHSHQAEPFQHPRRQDEQVRRPQQVRQAVLGHVAQEPGPGGDPRGLRQPLEVRPERARPAEQERRLRDGRRDRGHRPDQVLQAHAGDQVADRDQQGAARGEVQEAAQRRAVLRGPEDGRINAAGNPEHIRRVQGLAPGELVPAELAQDHDPIGPGQNAPLDPVEQGGGRPVDRAGRVPAPVLLCGGGEEHVDQRGASPPYHARGGDGLVGDRDIRGQPRRHPAGAPGRAEHPRPRAAPVGGQVEDLDPVKPDGIRRVRAGGSAEDGHLVPALVQAEGVLAEHPLPAPEDDDGRHIGDQEEPHRLSPPGFAASPEPPGRSTTPVPRAPSKTRRHQASRTMRAQS